MIDVKSRPVIFVIFGATGDLNWRKINPALYNLFLDKWLPDQFAILGTGRSEYSDEKFCKKLLDGVNQFSRSGKAEKSSWDAFTKHISYQAADIQDSAAFTQLGKRIRELSENWEQEATVIFYLAVASEFFPVIAQNIKKNKLAGSADRTRIVILEGHDAFPGPRPHQAG
jgi:glucose-6-phosphate 1-dehydrogenase